MRTWSGVNGRRTVKEVGLGKRANMFPARRSLRLFERSVRNENSYGSSAEVPSLPKGKREPDFLRQVLILRHSFESALYDSPAMRRIKTEAPPAPGAGVFNMRRQAKTRITGAE